MSGSRADLVNRIILAAERGDTVILMHCEHIHDHFYDLFNQHYRAIDGIMLFYLFIYLFIYLFLQYHG